MKGIRVGVDISKQVFQVHAVDRHEKVLWRAKLKREQWLSALGERIDVGADVAMEACAGAHHWARELMKRGYRVKLIAPQFVKPYVKSNKTDRHDAEAICEAMSRPTMRFVSLKSAAQQDLQAMHRVRSELVQQRTAKVNQVRGLVGEFGLIAPVGIRKLRAMVPEWLEDGSNDLSAVFRQLLFGLWEDLQHLDARVSELDKAIGSEANQDPRTKRLMQLRGVGPLIATALVASIGDGREYRRGRDFAASIGVTPRVHGTGGKDRLLGISKRGDGYLRKLLVHGARAVVRFAPQRDDPLSRWVQKMVGRKHPNVVCVALANKTARMAWAMLRHGADYEPVKAACA